MKLSDKRILSTTCLICEMLAEFDMCEILPTTLRAATQNKIAKCLEVMILMSQSAGELDRILAVVDKHSGYFSRRLRIVIAKMNDLHAQEHDEEMSKDVGDISKETMDLLAKLSSQPKS